MRSHDSTQILPEGSTSCLPEHHLVAVAQSHIPLSKRELDGTLTRRFLKVVEQLPDSLALIDGEVRFTFRELNRRANQIAHYLLQEAPHADCVAFQAPQGWEMVVLTLGILKAQRVQIALHPALPAPAREAILRLAKPDRLLSEAVLEEAAHCSTEEPAELSGDGGDICKVFYTSGTTSRPKGVMKSHRMILHRVWLGQHHDQIGVHDRASLMTHVAFASAEADLFATLLLGGTCCLFDVAREGFAAMKSWLRDEEITLFHPPVLLFRKFCQTLPAEESFPRVRLVALAGETVLPRDIEAWSRAFPHSELRHRFSTTETGTLTVLPLPAGSQALETVSCGHTVEDKLLSLRSEDGAVTPAGEEGELWVRSRFLASGYWRDPETTRRHFHPDPHDPDSRLYRTGDRGRFLDDGSFQYLGRRDDQVKIRGYRLSLKEVETALLELSGVEEAVVAAVESVLSASVVLRPGVTRTVCDLREELSRQLPSWKRPTDLNIVERLPKTLTGKVDRPAVFRHNASLVERLQALWTKLGKPRVEPGQDLIAAGADSISVVLFLFEVESEFGVGITPQQFFQDRSLSRLADRLSSMGATEQEERATEGTDVGSTCDTMADLFLKTLIRRGVECVFLNPGTDSAPLLESLARFRERGWETPRLVMCPHESVALSAAHGHYMMSGRPQLVFVHVDLGTQNLGGNLHNAQRARAAVVICAGRSPHLVGGTVPGARDRYAHWIQEQRDQAGSVRNYVKWDYDIPRRENLVPGLTRAFQLASGVPPGPVYVSVAREVLLEPASGLDGGDPREGVRSANRPDQTSLGKAVDWLLEAENPLVLVSQSGRHPESVPALVELAERLSLPIVETRHRMNFPWSHPLHQGFTAQSYLPEADLVLVLDHDVPWIPNQWTPANGCRVIQLDVDTQKPDMPMWTFPVDLALEGDSREVLRELDRVALEKLTAGHEPKLRERRTRWHRHHHRLRRLWREKAEAESVQSPMSPSWFAHCLNSFLDDSTLVVCDAATNNPVFWKHLQLDRPGAFFQSLGSSLGWGLGAALGAKLAQPEKTVLALVGDGGWFFGNPLAVYQVSERENRPFLTVVLNNGKYAAITEAVQSLSPGGAARRNRDYPGCALAPPGYYARIGEAAGLSGILMNEPGELEAQLARGFEELSQGRSVLMEVVVSSPHD